MSAAHASGSALTSKGLLRGSLRREDLIQRLRYAINIYAPENEELPEQIVKYMTELYDDPEFRSKFFNPATIVEALKELGDKIILEAKKGKEGKRAADNKNFAAENFALNHYTQASIVLVQALLQDVRGEVKSKRAQARRKKLSDGLIVGIEKYLQNRVSRNRYLSSFAEFLYRFSITQHSDLDKLRAVSMIPFGGTPGNTILNPVTSPFNLPPRPKKRHAE
jgi:hypothetical protein